MERRKFVVGLGSLAAGGAAAMGTGAFTSVAAERDVTVEVAGDNSAYLGLKAVRTDIISDDGGDGQLSLDLGSQVTDEGGEGFNRDAVTEIEGVFKITNQGTQDVGAGFVTERPVRNRNMTGKQAVIPGVTFEVQNAESFDGSAEGARLAPGESALVDVTVDTLDYEPEKEEDGSVIIGAYVEDF